MVIMEKQNKDKLREVPLKNYLYLLLVLIGSFLILFYAYNWYNTYNENKLNISIMIVYLTVINYNELDNYIIENKNAIIYVSILGDEKINHFEREFKTKVVANNLKNSLLYLDLTNEDTEHATNKLQIKNLPSLVVYTNGQITDTYDISKNNYNSKKTIKYLNRIGATEND